MAKVKYLALLRGINVGGNNIIKMADLKVVFESIGLTEVKTYIQSGNVIFESEEKDKSKLTTLLEKTLSEKFNYKSLVVIITFKQLKKVVEDKPTAFGDSPDEYRYDVIFLKEPLTAKEAIKEIRPNEGVDEAHAGTDVLYFSRLISKASQSHLSKIVALAMYKNTTIRNWNTTSKLLALMSAE